MASKLRLSAVQVSMVNYALEVGALVSHEDHDAVIAHRVRVLLVPILSGAQRTVSSELRAQLIGLLGDEE